MSELESQIRSINQLHLFFKNEIRNVYNMSPTIRNKNVLHIHIARIKPLKT